VQRHPLLCASFVTALRRCYPPCTQAHSQPGLGHAFCLSTAECDTVAQLVHASVAAALQEAAGDGAASAAAGRGRSGVVGRVEGQRAAPAFGS
jgi:hypothetical protein